MFLRVLVWMALLLGGWWMLRKRTDASPARPGGAGASRSAGAAAGAEAMVSCARCGVHMPASEAVRDAGAAFCCEAHRAAGG